MTRIVLVRHGETVWHAENRYAGSSDIALTRRGEQQAARLGAWAAGAGIARIVASPLARAQATARPAAARTGLSVILEPRLRELDFGAGEGLTAAEMLARFPAAYEAFQRDPVAHSLPGGEEPAAAITRARAALEALTTASQTQEAGGGRILVVTHNTLIRLVLCDLLGIAPARYRQVFPQLDNVALTELALTPGRPAALIHFNVPLPGSREDQTHAC